MENEAKQALDELIYARGVKWVLKTGADLMEIKRVHYGPGHPKYRDTLSAILALELALQYLESREHRATLERPW